MKESKALEHFKEMTRITNPEFFELLGPNWKTILNFWTFIDRLTIEQWNRILFNNFEGNYDYNVFITAEAGAITEKTFAIQHSTWYVAYVINANINVRNVARYVSYELVAMHEILNAGRTLIYLPLFENL